MRLGGREPRPTKPKRPTLPENQASSPTRCLEKLPRGLVSRTLTRGQPQMISDLAHQLVISAQRLGFSKIMIPQKFNVCSCHFAFCAECIYEGVVGVER